MIHKNILITGACEGLGERTAATSEYLFIGLFLLLQLSRQQ
jgi:short-subunit dehydrogenase